MTQKENFQFTDADFAMAENIAKLPQRCVESLCVLVKYLDTPMLEEIISPDTALERLYELFVIWIEEGLYELLILTALKIKKKKRKIEEYKIDEARKNLGLPN